MGNAKVTFNSNTLIDLTDATATADHILSGQTAYGATGDKLTGTIDTKTQSNLTVSGDTVTVPAGYYASSASKSVASGTAGTPTATKGTVSNHSISVTPSVTNTTGYITGSTKTGTAVTVSASELVSGSQTIEENDTYDVTNLASVVVNVEGEPGEARIVDTPDTAGGTIRSITTGEETSLTTKTVTPSDETQIVTGGNYVCKSNIVSTPAAHTQSGAISWVANTGRFTPSTKLTLNAQYVVLGRINVIDSNNDILEYYDINTIITWSTENIYLVENNTDGYYRSMTIRHLSTTYDIEYNYQYEKNATYGFRAELSFYEKTEYDGLSQVTVNPVPDTYYSSDFMKNMIQRDSSFTTFNFPDGITSIGNYAFANCQYLTLTSLPSGITSIGDYAFYYCTKIALTSLPSGLNFINPYAFYNCRKLALTSLPSGITTINNYEFYNCLDLALTSLPSGITSIGQYAFFSCTNLALTSLPSGLTTINSNAFYGCTNLALTSLPSGLTTIGGSAFRFCTSLAITSLPSGVTSIQSNTFQCCTGLTTISCTGAIITLGSQAFLGDSSNHMQLTSARFPNMALTSNIGTVFGNLTADYACQELEICDIGTTTGIAGNAFANCYKLQTLILRRTSVCTLSATSAFTNTPLSGYNGLTATVYVPNSLISSYQTASNWSTLYNAGNVTFSAIEGSQYELS